MTAYYNEHDPYPAQWLRNLASAGHLPAGSVDERSITDVQPDDVRSAVQAHFFAGIGGWPLALRLAGWPDDEPVWTGSCPCQPFSVAGNQKGEADERHLWPEFRRLIAECRPRTVFGEQVASAAGRAWLASVRADLERMDYAVGAADLCGASAGAPHIRQRLFWVAHSLSAGRAEWRSGAGYGSPSGSGSVERLAHLHGEGRGERSQRDGGQDEPGRRSSLGYDVGGRGEDGRMGHADEHISRRNGRSGVGPEAAFTGGGIGDRYQRDASGASGADGRMGDPMHARLPLGSLAEERRGDLPGKGLAVATASPEGGVANGDHSNDWTRRGAGGWPESSDGSVSLTLANAWGNVAWLPCSDGKLRPTQPGLFPLAHGVRGRMAVSRTRIEGCAEVQETRWYSRVGALRGFGNAIIPQVAAVFVRAFMMTAP